MKEQISHYKIKKILSKGQFGIAYLAEDLENNNGLVVIKEINKKELNTDTRAKLLESEINTMKLLSKENSQFIVKLIEEHNEEDFAYIIMQYCSQGTLYSQLKKRGHFQEFLALEKLQEIATGLQLVHSKKIIHRDIKLDNIFISNNRCIIGDFGFAIQASCDDKVLGTLSYMAPELLKKTVYNSKIDIWALGIVFFQMLFGILPFQSKSIIKLISEIKHFKLQKKYNEIEVSDECFDLLSQMLKLNPKERISCEQILGHQALKKLTIHKVYSLYKLSFAEETSGNTLSIQSIQQDSIKTKQIQFMDENFLSMLSNQNESINEFFHQSRKFTKKIDFGSGQSNVQSNSFDITIDEASK